MFNNFIPFLLFSISDAHRTLPPGVTCGNQFNTKDNALVVPNSKVSWANYHIYTCDQPVMWIEAATVDPGQTLRFSLLHPVLERFASNRGAVLLTGPGLPSLSDADKSKLPATVMAEKGVLFEAPQDQSSCSHVTPFFSNFTKVADGRCCFFEGFTKTPMWVHLDIAYAPPQVGTYQFAAFNTHNSPAKFGFTCCDWPEDFITPYPIPESSCPFCGTAGNFNGYFDLFFEQYEMAEYGGFPDALSCPQSLASLSMGPQNCPSSDESSQPESCNLGCVNGECHSHNIFGDCAYEVTWSKQSKSPTLSGIEVHSMILFVGDTISIGGLSATLSGITIASLWELGAANFQSCDLSAASQLADTSSLVDNKYDIKFEQAGMFYYSTADEQGCEGGLKLMVEVKDTSAGLHCHDHTEIDRHAHAETDPTDKHDHANHGLLQLGEIVKSHGAFGKQTTCRRGFVLVHHIGNADYRLANSECGELCIPSVAAEAPGSPATASCASVGFGILNRTEKAVQLGNFPPFDVEVFTQGQPSPTCHCHSYEDIKCDASGDDLYDEHIDEIVANCQGVVNGTATTCPYLCFQPFEILHIHYILHDSRPWDALYRRIYDTGLCHQAARPPAGLDKSCSAVDPTPGGDLAYLAFSSAGKTPAEKFVQSFGLCWKDDWQADAVTYQSQRQAFASENLDT